MPLPRDRDAFLLVHLALVTPDADDRCAICLDPYGTKHVPVRIVEIPNCSHVFGRHCLEEWVKSDASSNNTCPMCRTHLFKRLGSSSTAPALLREVEEDLLRRSEEHRRSARQRLVEVLLENAEILMSNGLRFHAFASLMARPENYNAINESELPEAAVSDSGFLDNIASDIFTASGVLPPHPHDLSNDSQSQASEEDSLAGLRNNLRTARQSIAEFMDVSQARYNRITNADASDSVPTEENRSFELQLFELTHMVEELQLRRGEIHFINMAIQYMQDDQDLRAETRRLNEESQTLEGRIWAQIAMTRTDGGRSVYMRQDLDFLRERLRREIVRREMQDTLR